MIINGKEYKFFYSVRARLAIAKTLPGHNMAELGNIFKKGDQVESLALVQTMAVEMNRAYLLREAQENGTTFNPDEVLDKNLILDMSSEEEERLEDELVAAFAGGNKTEIQTEAAGKKTKKEPKKQS